MWPNTQLQKPSDTHNTTQPGLPFTENSRSTYVSFENLSDDGGEEGEILEVMVTSVFKNGCDKN